MKTLLALLIAATAGGYYAATTLERAYAAKAQLVADPLTREPSDPFALGVEALTGRLTERRLAELEAALPRQEGRQAQWVSEYPPADICPSSTLPASVRANVVEAWADRFGLEHERLADGSEWLRLESGTLVCIQPSTTPGLAPLSPVQ